jgi:hypothetical protein
MNPRLDRLAKELNLSSAAQQDLALAFGYACVDRVKHLLERPEARDLLERLRAGVASRVQILDLESVATEAAALARSHSGSVSIDGSGHSAVSATHALARAAAGRAVEAAEYAAYAAVYSYGRYAIQDPSAFDVEFNWQMETLLRLSRERRLVQ